MTEKSVCLSLTVTNQNNKITLGVKITDKLTPKYHGKQMAQALKNWRSIHLENK
jgi:hypothetical protein